MSQDRSKMQTHFPLWRNSGIHLAAQHLLPTAASRARPLLAAFVSASWSSGCWSQHPRAASPDSISHKLVPKASASHSQVLTALTPLSVPASVLVTFLLRDHSIWHAQLRRGKVCCGSQFIEIAIDSLLASRQGVGQRKTAHGMEDRNQRVIPEERGERYFRATLPVTTSSHQASPPTSHLAINSSGDQSSDECHASTVRSPP